MCNCVVVIFGGICKAMTMILIKPRSVLTLSDETIMHHSELCFTLFALSFALFSLLVSALNLVIPLFFVELLCMLAARLEDFTNHFACCVANE